MCLVTVYASHGPRFVRAASPEKLIFAGVALQTGKVFLGYCVLRTFGKAEGNRILATPCLDVCTAGTVTRFASASLVRSVRMCHRFSHSCSVESSALILVAGDTGIAADIVAVGLGL